MIFGLLTSRKIVHLIKRVLFKYQIVKREFGFLSETWNILKECEETVLFI